MSPAMLAAVRAKARHAAYLTLFDSGLLADPRCVEVLAAGIDAGITAAVAATQPAEEGA